MYPVSGLVVPPTLRVFLEQNLNKSIPLFKQIFIGNDDSKTVVVRHLKHPITARYVRIHPLAWYGVHICMRAELYGCDHLGQSLYL